MDILTSHQVFEEVADLFNELLPRVPIGDAGRPPLAQILPEINRLLGRAPAHPAGKAAE